MLSSVIISVLLVTMVTDVLPQTAAPVADPNQISLIVPNSVDDCYRGFMETQLSEQASQVACLQELLWTFQPAANYSLAESSYYQDLFGSAFTTNPQDALPPSGYRVRREARTMSAGEWKRFRDALNTLYQDGTIRRFAELHAQAVDSHYGGPSFLPWNRIFLLMFEEALRKVDRHVFLAYWDPSIDEAMSTPVNSIVWEPGYFGTGTGVVDSGLGAGWVTDQGYLQRDYGRDGRLTSKAKIRELMRQCRLEDISRPTASPEHDMELIQGGPQVWVGGDMAHPSTAGFDPLFYMHRAYVDYAWELFRVRQANNCSVPPTTDYPSLPADDTHNIDAPMLGFDWLTNRNGIQGNWIESWYSYEIHPTCSDCCPSCLEPEPMSCDTTSNVCVSRSRRSFPLTSSDTTIPTREQFLDPSELLALSTVTPPRNRGQEFDHPPSDGRTLSTAIYDTIAGLSTPGVPTTVPNSRTDGASAFATQSRSPNIRRRTRTRSGSSFDQQSRALRPNRANSVTNPRTSSNRFATQRVDRRDRRRMDADLRARQMDTRAVMSSLGVQIPRRAPLGDSPGLTRQDVRRVSSRSPNVFVRGLHANSDRPLRRRTDSGGNRRVVRRPDMAVAPDGRVFERQNVGTDRLPNGGRSMRRSDTGGRRERRRQEGLSNTRRVNLARQSRQSSRRVGNPIPRTQSMLPRSMDVSRGMNSGRSFSRSVRSDTRVGRGQSNMGARFRSDTV